MSTAEATTTLESQPTATQLSMSDTTSEPQKQDVPDFNTSLNAARLLSTEEKWEDVVEMLSCVLEKLTKDQQESMPSMIAETYFCYGRALFRLSQTQTDVFGSAIREKQQEYAVLEAVGEEGKAEMDDADVLEPPESAPTDAPQAVTNGQPTNNEESSENLVDGDGKEADETGDSSAALVNAFASIFAQAENLKTQLDSGEQMDVDTSEDRELAWESFETTRSVLESMSTPLTEKQKRLLGDTYCMLGELMMEDEAFEPGMNSFDAAVRIFTEIGVQPRVIASVHSLWASAAEYTENEALAKEQFEKAAELVLRQIVQETGNTSVDAGGSKSEAMTCLEQKDAILEHAKKYCEQNADGEAAITDLKEVFQDLIERVADFDNSEAMRMELDEMKEDADQATGVTTVGFAPVEATSGPVNDLGSFGLKKKKRTASDAELDLPKAKKQRIE